MSWNATTQFSVRHDSIPFHLFRIAIIHVPTSCPRMLRLLWYSKWNRDKRFYLAINQKSLRESYHSHFRRIETDCNRRNSLDSCEFIIILFRMSVDRLKIKLIIIIIDPWALIIDFSRVKLIIKKIFLFRCKINEQRKIVRSSRNEKRKIPNPLFLEERIYIDPSRA